MSYDPTDCELGICGPCEACIEQMKIDGMPHEEEAKMADDYYKNIDKDAAQVTISKQTPIGYIDITPSWHAIVGLYLEMLDRPEISEDKRQDMKDEILRAAKLADLYVKEHKR